MKLSIVTTLFYSANNVVEFYDRICSVAQKLVGEEYEIIMVDDGSPDESLKKATELIEKDSKLKVIELSRNFGHHKAMMTGLSHTTGDLVFLIDSDLEEEPEWLLSFAEKLDKGNFDVVYGTQRIRKGLFLEKLTGSIYYKFLNIVSNVDHPPNIVTARLMRQNYVKSLIAHQERDPVISFLWVITGFRQVSLEIDKLSLSPTSYSLSKKISHLINSITSFSEVPLVLIFYFGSLIFSCSFFYTLFLVIRVTYTDFRVEGWTSVMVSVWALGGLIISFLGIIGIYISKIFIESKKRPYTIIRKIYEK